MDLDPYRDGSGELHRNVLPHTATSIEFSTTHLRLRDADRLNGFVPRGIRIKCEIEYWNPNTSSYKAGAFYISDIPYEIVNFFSTFDFAAYGQTLSTFTIGLLDALTVAVEKTNWYEIGEKIGLFLSNLDWRTILNKTGKLIANGMVAAISLYISSASTAPIETAHVTWLMLAVGSISPIVIARTLWKKITGSIATMFAGGISIPSLIVTFSAFVGRFSNTAAFQVFGNEIVDLINGFVKETFGEKALAAMGDSLFIAVGTGIGAIFGGPIGAVVGLIISHSLMISQNGIPGLFGRISLISYLILTIQSHYRNPVQSTSKRPFLQTTL